MPDKPLVLFLCTGNSCRSQMAEGLARTLKGEEMEVYSAGIETHGLNPNAVLVMKEIGIDITDHKSQTVADLPVQEFDYVVTVCDNAHETCPIFPGQTRVVHQSFDDPPRLAEKASSPEDVLMHYRRVRNEIRDYILTLPQSLVDSAT
ncbi:MAG: arsenate reductase ArsC [Candidatus Sumerlaeota bacterium]